MREERAALGDFDDGNGEAVVVEIMPSNDLVDVLPVEHVQGNVQPCVGVEAGLLERGVGETGPGGEHHLDAVVLGVAEHRGDAAEVGTAVGVVYDDDGGRHHWNVGESGTVDGDTGHRN